MKLLKLTPADSFFFKGHMMSEMGVPSQWIGLFPPRPNTVYGALRSAYIHRFSNFKIFREGGDEAIRAWMGTPYSFGRFKQEAIFLRQGKQLLLPVPMDYRIFRNAASGNGNPVAESLTLAENVSISNTNARYTFIRHGNARREGKDIAHSGQFVPLDHWKNTVFNQKPIQDIRALEQIVTSYMKTGIKIDRATNGAEDAHFFQMNMLNMRAECELVSCVSDPGPDFSDVAMVSLGSENRPWFLEQEDQSWSFWSNEQMLQLEEKLHATGIARIILLTPLVLPDELSTHDVFFDGNLQLTSDINAELLTWASGRPELFGGWDIVSHRPKKRQLMLPMGTVFYVKILRKDIPNLLQLANGFHLLKEKVPDRFHEGFGFAVITG
ncbi:hypothetical protein IDH44_00285 [Paenibacillus sp. IB182496]|uniref:Type III-B CRISPR module-associated protein Cmr3 n=1 Tax=Paenibacillus sabuli TaxID=2772509 RepID=A0A927BN59_9BACL|nr:type III-B CRISPR module-associated Cmr3 family protein [Paenibacillus sabuli]MBD2843612.1 hypothetical protein [Paenibacillus sabuli]